jgi:hypothetical protein
LAATGRGLFVALTVALLGMALISGVVLTADCLSRERREGTLGFLFLTDLTGWDVVAGKLVALALVPFQAVLAVFPVAALSVFLGGVTYGEFWRVLLVVLLGLWMSLAVGMWVSSWVTDDRQAVGLSLLGMGALLGVPYLLGNVVELVPRLAGWSTVRVAGGDRAVRAGHGCAEPDGAGPVLGGVADSVGGGGGVPGVGDVAGDAIVAGGGSGRCGAGPRIFALDAGVWAADGGTAASAVAG